MGSCFAYVLIPVKPTIFRKSILMMEVLYKNPYVEELKRDLKEASQYTDLEMIEKVMIYVSQNQESAKILNSVKSATTTVAGMPKDIDAFLKNILGDDEPPEPEIA